jgi:hypothetical protein
MDAFIGSFGLPSNSRIECHISKYGPTLQNYGISLLHSRRQDVAAFDLWQREACDIFPYLDEYEPEFVVEDCGRDGRHLSSMPIDLQKIIWGIACPLTSK